MGDEQTEKDEQEQPDLKVEIPAEAALSEAEEARLAEMDAEAAVADDGVGAPAAESVEADAAAAESNDQDPYAAKTIDELREELRERDERERGLRRDLFRVRQMKRQAQAQVPQPAPKPDEMVELDGAEVDVDTGKVRIPRSKLPVQRVQPQGPAMDMPTQEFVDEIIETHESPEQAEEAVLELDTAFNYVDQLVTRRIRSAGVEPGAGLDWLLEFVEHEGVDKRFAERFPGIPLETLLRARVEKRAFRSLVSSRLAEKRKGNGADKGTTPSKEAERQKVRERVSAAPRSPARKGGQAAAGGRPSTKAALAAQSAEEYLSKSPEEMAEVDRILRGD